ncbi:MAG TPA: IS110 family transposase [Gemmatimonadaceae bacterium]|nr:IS110 family transposase [Gemmatimonadaceae bacterium]
MKTFRFHVGIDWADRAHQVSLREGSMGRVEEKVFDHSGAGLRSMIDWLIRRSDGQPGDVGVAIEITRGAIVEALMERGFAVFAINPKQLDRFRDRHTVAGAKDDRRDAFVLLHSLATDPHAFRELCVEDAATLTLREHARMYEDLKEDLRRLTNQLREQLHRYYSQMLALSSGADEPWVWDILERAPLPDQGARLRERSAERILLDHRIRRISAADVVEALRAPSLPLTPGAVLAARAHVALLLPRIRLTRAQLDEVEATLGRLLDEMETTEGEIGGHRDVKITRSWPGQGVIVAATMLAEGSRPLETRDYHWLRALCGVAPVTRQSGRARKVVMRQACNDRLRTAVHWWAGSAIRHDAKSKALYAAHKARGHSHGRSLRAVADRLLRDLIVCLAKGEPYRHELRRVA